MRHHAVLLEQAYGLSLVFVVFEELFDDLRL